MEIDGPVELHHKDGDHNNWKQGNLVALHRTCHQAQAVHRQRVQEGLGQRGKGIEAPEPPALINGGGESRTSGTPKAAPSVS